MKGKVKTLVANKGFGFIQGTDNVQYFFHKSSVKNGRIEDMEVGDEVEFEESEGEKGPRAEDIYL